MILQGNSIRIPLRDESVHAVVTSFPYYNLRSYGIEPTVWGGDSNCPHIWGPEGKITNTPPRDHNGANGFADTRGTEPHRAGATLTASTGQFCQLCGAWLGCFGLEPNIGLHVQNAVLVCREIKRVLMKTGVFWLNYGDSYSGGKNGRSAADTKAVGKDDRTFRDKPFSVTELPAKNLCMIPARVAIALQDDGWILRSEMGWYKGNAMPSSVQDRPGTAHEHVFMLVKSARYYWDAYAVKRPAVAGYNGSSFTNGKTAKAREHLAPIGQAERENQDGASGRALRTSDPFFDSLDAYIAHLQDVRDNGGMLVDSEGVPAALVVNSEQYKYSHYATFPRKLISPLIKTTPEKVCPECDKPWQRVVDKKPTDSLQVGNQWQNGRKSTNHHGPSRPGSFIGGESKTTGWQPTCKCNLPESDCVGAVICDPFAGSGTVGAVCRELGRRFIGIDLSAKYLAENALPRSEKKMSRKSLGQLPMFAKLDEAA